MTATMAGSTTPAHLRTDIVPGGRATLVGQSPRVSLMPPEIGERNRQKGVQRSLRLAVFAIVGLVIAAIIGCWYLSMMAEVALAEAKAETTSLLAQQAEYTEVRDALQAVGLGEAALAVGGSTEIDWQDYLNRVQASLPAGVTLDSFSVDASTITEQYPQSDIPLQGARIATLNFSAISPGLPEIPSWLDGLRSLPGFVDAAPGSVTQRDDGGYVATIVMHIDAEVYTNRLVQENEDGATDAAADETEADR